MDFNNYDVVADLYDIYVPATYDFDFFLNETKKCPGEVLELMSGSGRVSIPLLQAGVKLTCVDLSAGLNAVFEEKLQALGLQADVYRMDVCALELPKRFDMIIIPFHSFAHIASPDDQLKALCRIRAHLAPGGRFICTLGNPAIRGKAIDGQLRLARTYPLPESGGRLLLWISEHFSPADEQVVEAMQFYEEYDARGVLTSKRLMELHFSLLPRDGFEQLAGQAGFVVKALYGDYEYAGFNPETSPFMIFVMEGIETRPGE